MSDVSEPNTQHVSRLLFVAAGGAFMCLVFLLLLAASMEKELNHDEHMYVSAGVLLSEKLQVPYRDFPYLQMPNLVFMYAGLFSLLQWPGYFLLEARVFSTACATACLGVLFVVVASVLRDIAYGWRFLAAASSVVVVMANPIFRYTSGQAWNHDASVLLALLAFVAVHKAARGGWGVRWTLSAGVLLGLAVGTRLTFAFVVPVFLGAVFLYPSPASVKAAWKERLRPLVLFGDGLMLGLVPSLVAFLMAPGQFVFGNFEYHQVNALFWERTGYERAMDLAGKLDYLWAVVTQPANLVLVVGSLSFMLAGLFAGRALGSVYSFELLFGAALLFALVLGALAPTPSWYQYFYGLVPFMVLVSAYGVALLMARAKWSLALFSLMLLLAVGLGRPGYSLRVLRDVEEWVPVKVRNLGVEVSRHAGRGKVLTFAPVHALEGGADVYSLFAAGPFLWRSESLLDSGERRDLEVPTQAEFMALLEKEPPRAILTGFEGGLEVPWIDFAREHGYERMSLPDEKVLWLRP